MNEQKIKITKPSGLGRYLALLIVAAGVLAYCNSLSGPFIFDDEDSIPGNTYIRELWPPQYLLSAPPESTVAGRPIVSLTLALNYAFCGYRVWGYHAVNLAIHILAGLVLYGVVRRTLLSERLKKRFGRHASALAWAVATIWLVHPIQTESVTYIIQRTESLMGLFYLLTLYAAMRAMDSKRVVGWSVLSVLCCGLGMATKEVMVTAPVIVLFYDRCFVAGSFSSSFRRRRGLYAGLAATWIILAGLMLSGPRSESVGFALGIGALDYAANQCRAIVHYLWLCFWPTGLCLDYSWPVSTDWGNFLPSIAVIVVIIAVTVWGFIRRHSWSFASVWFFGLLAPTSSFIPIADLVFEHRMYLPLAGLIIFIVLAGYVLLEISTGRFATARIVHQLGVFVVIVIAAVLMGRTLLRNRDYQTAESIWQSSVEVSPNNRRGHYNLANAYRSQGRLDEAISHYRRALEIRPDYPDAHNNLGLALKSQHRVNEAISHYLQALKLNPEHAEAHNNLGVALEADGALADAIGRYRRAIQIRPGYTDAHYNLGNALAVSGRLNEAVGHFQKVLELMPDDADVHNSLGLVLKFQGKVEQAIEHYRLAVQIKPGLADAHNNLGSALAGRGRFAEAIKHFREALAISGDDAEAHYNLGLALRLTGRLDEALGHFRQAVRVRPDYLAALNEAARILTGRSDRRLRDTDEAISLAEHAAELTGYKDAAVLETLASCYAAAGRFDRAVSTAQAALGIASSAGKKQLANRLKKQLERYRAAEP